MPKVVKSFSLDEDVAEALENLPPQARSRRVNEILRHALVNTPTAEKKSLERPFWPSREELEHIIRDILSDMQKTSEIAPEVQERFNKSLASILSMRNNPGE